MPSDCELDDLRAVVLYALSQDQVPSVLKSQADLTVFHCDFFKCLATYAKLARVVRVVLPAEKVIVRFGFQALLPEQQAGIEKKTVPRPVELDVQRPNES